MHTNTIKKSQRNRSNESIVYSDQVLFKSFGEIFRKLLFGDIGQGWSDPQNNSFWKALNFFNTKLDLNTQIFLCFI